MTYEILESCTGCGMCLSICPVKAVSGGPGRLHAINPDYCIGCGACARVCESSSVV
ncbi:MAG: 4Fe-4S binding protein, partial [Spirochaetales bacterium]|nr:4Fe-4S binding protein [Spirochaetales bacterium]